MPEIKKTGARLVAISPMLTKYAPQLVSKLELTFPVLSDPGSKVMATWGVLFRLADELIEVYKGFGIDLERFNGEGSWQLPLSGRIIVAQDGVVKSVELSYDHTDRPEPQETLEFLKAL